MIRLIDVQKTYDNGTRALKGVSMRIEDGEFVFLVGPSGSGKSTILKLITGEVSCTEGRLMVNGYNLNNIHVRQIPYLRRTLGVIFQDFRLIEKKTVEENLTFVMRVVGASPREIRKRVSYVLQLVGLDHKGDRLPTELSGGEQQMLAIGRALMSNPKMLLLDEPSMGLSPLLVEEIFQIIQDVNKSGVTVLLVEQNAKMAMQIANRVYVMETGTIMMSGNSEEMRNNEQVRRAYLGG